MRLAFRHRGRLTPRAAMRLQQRLRTRIVAGVPPDLARLGAVAGLDVCYSAATDRCYAAVVVMAFPSLEVIEERTAAMRSPFPYVPGLLSFREAPPLIAALRRLRTLPGALLLDAQGRAHPRRMGLASHIGLIYDHPSVGCAKTRLCGAFDAPGPLRGDWSALRDDITGGAGEIIGSVVRTRDWTAPVFVSVGHRCDDAFARALVLACAPRYRLPEPIRRAHQLSNAMRRRCESTS